MFKSGVRNIVRTTSKLRYGGVNGSLNMGWSYPMMQGIRSTATATNTNTTTTNTTTATPTTNTETTPTTVDNLKYLKLDSIGSNSLYAILRLHNIPYLVTKGDKIILPTKMKGVQVGDQLDINKVTTIGTNNFTYNDENGINPTLYTLKANVVEITREPYYEVYRTKQRNRRIKTFPVENFQTILMINELCLN